ncbi:MAG: hypothetical protein DMG27_02730 [Acidobacteria bacterium]|nr:MAG: hypothetical protein DMG27_02730 [Acidobacteriota bacterium]
MAVVGRRRVARGGVIPASIALEPEQLRRLARVARVQGRSRSNLVRRMIDEALARYEAEPSAEAAAR